MTDKPSKPPGGEPTGALPSDPHENADRAEEIFDSPHRREQEEAMRNKNRSQRNGGDILRDSTTTRPPD